LDITFEKASPEDSAVILDLADKIWKETFLEYHSQEKVDHLYNIMYGGTTVKDEIASGKFLYYIIKLEGKAAAYASISEYYEKENTWKLNKIYLLPEMQGKGIASYIMNKIYGIVKEAGAKNLLLTVNRSNGRAINFYKKEGFVITGSKDFDMGEGIFMDDYIMEKNLEE
jgi:GNAT superfamily N-acetyltransferase